MIDLTPGTPFHPFVDAVSKAAGEVLSQALGTKWMVEIDTADGTRLAETPVLCFQLSASGGLQGDALIRIRTTDALLLAQRFLTESIDPSAELNTPRKKAVEGVEIALVASEPSSAKLVLGLMLGREMLASVKTELQVQTQGADAATGGDSHQQKFDLLLDVDVSLTLRFGQRMLTLREILDLTSGSIVELDREVQEPADLLLGDKLIARGQVVIVDGNYGIRITEV